MLLSTIAEEVRRLSEGNYFSWTLAWNILLYLFVISALQTRIFYTAEVASYFNTITWCTYCNFLSSWESGGIVECGIDSRGENVWIGKGIDVTLSLTETIRSRTLELTGVVKTLTTLITNLRGDILIKAGNLACSPPLTLKADKRACCLIFSYQ